MTNQVINEIITAEQKAAEIVESAQAEARAAVLSSQKDLKIKFDEKITDAKTQAKELILQKKEYLKKQSVILKQNSQTRFQEFQQESALKMEGAANFIAERIIK